MLVLAVDLRAVTGEEEQCDIIAHQRVFEALQPLVQGAVRAVDQLVHLEGAGAEFSRYVVLVVAGIVEFAAALTSGNLMPSPR